MSNLASDALPVNTNAPLEGTGEATGTLGGLPAADEPVLQPRVVAPSPAAPQTRTLSSRFARNSAANVVRLGITSLVAILLPAYLTHHLPLATYGAWVLILQLAAYVGYLDFGVQTAISKYIAEFEAKGDLDSCGRVASVGFAIMLGASALGIVGTCILAWEVPALFGSMPVALLGDVRRSVVLVGVSLSLSLAATVFTAIFLGLQRYQIPMFSGVATRLLYTVAVLIAVRSHCSLTVMGAAVAGSNILGAVLQVVLWKKLASHVKVSLRLIELPMLRQVLRYCAVLTVWSVCMLFITGIDVSMVGHYAFQDVGFYSIANSPTTLMLMILGAAMAPLLPATSAMSVNRTSREMGDVLVRSTRYSAIVLLLSGLPLLVGGFFLFKLWVGPVYALRSLAFLRVLLIANIIRNLCAPYATVVVALSRQRVATFSAISEGVVNLGASLFLASRYGAIGVAMGTLLGAIVGVALHFLVSMHYTQRDLAISRWALFSRGLLRPSIIAIPSVLLLPLWWRTNAAPLPAWVWAGWAVATLLLTIFGALTRRERQRLSATLGAAANRLRYAA